MKRTELRRKTPKNKARPKGVARHDKPPKDRAGEKANPNTRRGFTKAQIGKLDSLARKLIIFRSWGWCKRSWGWCEDCGRYASFADLDHHHPISRRYLGYRWEPLNGIALCRPCHLMAHKYKKVFTGMLRSRYPDRAKFFEDHQKVTHKGPLDYKDIKARLTEELRCES